MRTHLNVVVLHTENLDAARSYFTGTLKLEVGAEHPGRVLEFVAQGGAELALQERPGATGSGQELWLIVEDTDTYHAQVLAAGANVVQAPHDGPFGRAFTVRTPDGHRLTFHSGEA